MTDLIGALCTWLTGAVLASSGLLKLGTARKFQLTLSQFGLPRWTWQDDRFARAFPWCEIALAATVTLLPFPIQLLPSLAILALFIAFLVLVLRVRRRPTPVSCNCFGGLGDDTVGIRTVIRNGVLVAVALAAVVLHRAPASVAADRVAGWCYPLPAVLAAAVAGALVVWRGIAARRSRARLIRTLTVQDVDGNELPITEFQDPPTVLVFFAPGCSACHALVQDFRWWPNVLRDNYDLQPVFVGRPEVFATQETFQPLVPHAWYDTDLALAKALHISATPSGILIDADRPLGGSPVSGHLEIRKLAVDEDLVEAHARDAQT